MRAIAAFAVFCLCAAAQAEPTGITPASGTVPTPERACSAPGITPPTPQGSHATSEADYPSDAKRFGEQGNVGVSFLIHEDGTVSDTTVVRSSGSTRLDSATTAVVMRWRYNPAKQNGVSISCRHRAMIAWRLSETQNFVDGEPRFLPPELMQNGVLGATTFWVSLDENGNVISIRVLMSSGDPRVDYAGQRLLQYEKYTPPQMNGKPVQSTIPVEVRWSPVKPAP
jgi:TonB family protein